MTVAGRVISLHPDADAIGDWNAPEGSEAWCRALRLSMQTRIKEIGRVPDKIRWYVEKAVEHRAWVHWQSKGGEQFKNFEAFCEEPQPWGLGMPWQEVKPFLDAVRGAVAVAGLVATPSADPEPPPKHIGPGRGRKNGDSGTTRVLKRDSVYWAGRIKAKAAKGDSVAAAVDEAVMRGDYNAKGMQAAVRDAGVVKPADPVKLAVRALRKVPDERRHEVLSSDVRGLQMAIRRLTAEEQAQLYEWLVKELRK